MDLSAQNRLYEIYSSILINKHKVMVVCLGDDVLTGIHLAQCICRIPAHVKIVAGNEEKEPTVPMPNKKIQCQDRREEDEKFKRVK